MKLHPQSTPAMEILRLVADAYGVAQCDLKRPGGGKLISEAKKAAIDRLREQGHSLQVIGRLMGGMHHTTILHHLERSPRNRRELKPTNAMRLAALEDQVRALQARLAEIGKETEAAWATRP